MVFILRRGSVPYCCSNNINSTEVSLSDILFSFMMEKYTVFDVCGLRSLSFESSNVLYITYIYIYVYYIYNPFNAGIHNARNVTQNTKKYFRCNRQSQYSIRWLGVRVSLRSMYYLSQKLWHFHKNTRSCVENQCCCPRTVNISNVNFTSKYILHIYVVFTTYSMHESIMQGM